MPEMSTGHALLIVSFADCIDKRQEIQNIPFTPQD